MQRGLCSVYMVTLQGGVLPCGGRSQCGWCPEIQQGSRYARRGLVIQWGSCSVCGVLQFKGAFAVPERVLPCGGALCWDGGCNSRKLLKCRKGSFHVVGPYNVRV